MPIDVDVVPKSTYITNTRENTRNLWLGLLTGPTTYALYFIIGYLLAEATCNGELLGVTQGNLTFAIAGMTVLAGIITITTAFYSYRSWQRHQEQRDDAGRALAFMAFGSILLSLLFTLLIAVTGVAVFFLLPCRWV